MTQKDIMQKPFILLILIAALVSGCSTPTPTPMPSPLPPPPEMTSTSFFSNVEVTVTTSAPTQTVIVQTPIMDECKNPFYPVHNGAWWMHSLSNGSRPSHTMLVDGNNTFTVTVQNEDNTLIIEGHCTEAGIILLDSPGSSLIYSGGQGSSTLVTQNVDGVTLPNDVQVGDSWSQTINVSGGNMDGIVETSYSAVGYETVNVPAGTFNALKVEQNGLINMSGQTFNSHAFFWYAENVGVVKSVIEDAVSSELLAYNFP